MKHEELKQYYHNKGEQDYWKKDYNPPHNVLGGFFNSQRQNELNEAYSKGWSNAREQDKK